MPLTRVRSFCSWAEQLQLHLQGQDCISRVSLACWELVSLLDTVTTCYCTQHQNHIDQSQQGCHPCWFCPWSWTHGLLLGYSATIEGVLRHGLQLVRKGSGITKTEIPGKRKQIGVIAQRAAFCLLLGGFWPCRDSSTHSRYKLLWPRSMLSVYLLLIARRAPSI